MSPSTADDLRARARRVRWLVLDVDGVLTDGRLFYGPSGEELKIFHVRDGLALRLVRQAGLHTALLSARQSKALKVRAQELGIDELVLGREDKAAAFEEFVLRHGLSSAEVAYVGDDLQDLPVVQAAGLSFAPSDAAPEVKEQANWTLDSRGGRGAVRETVETLLGWRGEWAALVARYGHTSSRAH